MLLPLFVYMYMMYITMSVYYKHELKELWTCSCVALCVYDVLGASPFEVCLFFLLQGPADYNYDETLMTLRSMI